MGKGVGGRPEKVNAVSNIKALEVSPQRGKSPMAGEMPIHLKGRRGIPPGIRSVY